MYKMRREKVEGSISVFLAVTLTLILSFCMVLIESARENTMLLKADVVFNAGVQSVLAKFHTALWEEYDLLYLDCGYGTGSASYGLVKSHLEGYIHKNLEFQNKGWLGLDYAGAKITDVLLATDYNGKDFYMQAIHVAKSSIGVTYMEQVLSWFKQIESTYSTGDFLKSEARSVTESIDNVNGTEIEVEEAVWGTDIHGNFILLEDAEYEVVDIANPLEKILSANILLQQVIEDYSTISDINVASQELASHRSLAMGTMQNTGEKDSFGNKILFCKYVMDHFACYVKQKKSDTRALHCELEYLIGGKSSDRQNLEIVTAELLLIREIDNYLLLLQDEAKQLEAHGIAAAAASLVPWLEPVVYQALLIYWAYEESVQDVQALFRGETVPLVKSLPLEGVSEFSLGYEEYLLLLLLMQGKETLVMRSMDVIEVSLREEDASFQMDACIGQACLVGEFYDKYNKKYMISKEIRYY